MHLFSLRQRLSVAWIVLKYYLILPSLPGWIRNRINISSLKRYNRNAKGTLDNDWIYEFLNRLFRGSVEYDIKITIQKIDCIRDLVNILYSRANHDGMSEDDSNKVKSGVALLNSIIKQCKEIANRN